jgi:hypothetical protein
MNKDDALNKKYADESKETHDYHEQAKRGEAIVDDDDDDDCGSDHSSRISTSSSEEEELEHDDDTSRDSSNLPTGRRMTARRGTGRHSYE